MKKILINFDEKISMISLIFMLVLSFINVIGRYIFSASISITDEIVGNLFVFVSTLGIGIATKHQAHLGLSVITDRLPNRCQRYINCFSDIMGAFLSLFILYNGIIMVIHQYKLGSTSIGMRIPEWVYGSFIPIGSTAMTYHFAISAVKSLNKDMDGKE